MQPIELLASPWTWLIIGLLFLGGELLIIGFYLLPLGATAIVVSVFVVFSPWDSQPLNWILPCLAFLVLGSVSLVTIRPFMINLMYKGGQELNVSALINKQALVVETIDPVKGEGRVRIENETWAARSTNEDLIPQGTLVTVNSIVGNHANVAKQEEKS